MKMDLKLQGTFGDYDLFENEGKYYALLSSTVDKNAAELISEKKAIESDELESLKSNIEEAVRWADTRGMSSFQNTCQTNVIRANSFNTLSEQSHKFDDPRLVIFEGDACLVEASDYDELKLSDKELQRYFITAISQHAVCEQVMEYKSHTIFVHDRIYYALPHGIGEMHWNKLNVEYLKEILVRLVKAKTVKGVMDKLDTKAPSNNVSLTKDERREIAGEEESFNTKSITKSAEKQCDINLKSIKTQIEIEEYRGYTIYEFENTFFARPKSSAAVDFAIDDFFARGDVLYDVSITGLREFINSK